MKRIVQAAAGVLVVVVVVAALVQSPCIYQTLLEMCMFLVCPNKRLWGETERQREDYKEMKTITRMTATKRQNGTFTQTVQGHTTVLKLLQGVVLVLGSGAAAGFTILLR